MAMQSGATVFVLLLDCPTGALILEQGYSMKLFKHGTIIFGNQAITNGNPVQYMSPNTDVAAIFKGYFGINFDPAFAMRHFSSSQTFLQKMQSLGPIGYMNSTGSLICNNATDDEGHLLYINTYGNCSVFSFADLDATTISPKAAATYDAVKVMVQGMSHVSGSYVDDTIAARLALYDTMVNSSALGPYFGATGLVSFAVRLQLASIGM